MAAERSEVEIDGSLLEGVSIFVEFIAFLLRSIKGAYSYVHNAFIFNPRVDKSYEMPLHLVAF